MAHARAKFVQALNNGNDEVARRFIKLIDELYRKERYYKQGHSPQQIYEGRQSEDTTRIENELRRLLSEELSKKDSGRSYYMQQALNYFDHFKEGLFRYRDNGRIL